MKKIKRLLHSNGYYILIVVTGLASLVVLVLSYLPGFDVSRFPYLQIDILTLVIFSFDYFVRLFLAPNKVKFLRKNIVDLLAILPFNTIFNAFRIFRVVNIISLTKIFTLIRFIGTAGKLQKNAKKILKINGFFYLIIICGIVLVTATIMYSLAENVSLSDSFWWAIVTASTVGYGDVAPKTLVGRLAAISLMIIGIGFIGTLTSTITSYFTQENNVESEDKLDKILVKLDKIESENKQLRQEINDLKAHQKFK
ncbi:potassium channel family protein [Companilactobacillus halodurans]|uniref:Potassium channel family protein n=1 Tax=Companilactobacillus halodurans TaxID=2584183 RepID=A0A5P0ZLN6_9LACO|nr:potassium channel family protein [Companilactobacillus halodurans]MQS75160.1 potassium channel family protein [Companilactobacillus halodurans]MQS97575.1 potassium channel family protein [Companilactobacillus halodurans]